MFLTRLTILAAVCAAAVSAEKKIVTTIEQEPFFQKNSDNKYEGYIVDLLDAVSKRANFEYELRIVSDKMYGRFDEKTGQWSGLMGEIVAKTADLAAAPLTITPKRQEYAEFVPFMDAGISIMMLKPQFISAGVFCFLDPLSNSVWLSLLGAYLVLSLILWLIARYSPCEHGCQEHIEASPAAAVVIRARSLSGRFAGATWWLLTLIVIGSYTANLAANLAVERMSPPILSPEDLGRQHLIKYGGVQSGTTTMFFMNSNDTVYQRMWAAMSQDSSSIVKNVPDGVERVRRSNGRFAFLLESRSNDYYNTRAPCDTYKVGRNIDKKSYGLAFPKGSSLKASVESTINALRDNGDLDKMEAKWFSDNQCGENAGKLIVDGDGHDTKNALTMNNLAGVFYVAIIGLVITILILAFEFLFQAKKDAAAQNASLGETVRRKAGCAGSPQTDA